MAKNKNNSRKAADWDIEESMSVNEFFELHEVPAKSRTFKVKECEAEDGSTFMAVGFTDGDTYTDDNGKERPSMTFFALSQNCISNYELDDADEDEVKDFLRQNKANIGLLEPVKGVKFGKLFVSGGGELWDDL